MRASMTGFVAGPAPVCGATSFQGAAVCGTRSAAPVARTPARVRMGAVENRAAKASKIESVQEVLADAEFVFQVPLPGITVSQVSELKSALPEGSSCRTVKNTLMKRAIQGSDWVLLGDLCKESTVWFFVKEDIKGTVKAYQKFAKDNKREDILGGCFEGALYDAKGVKDISELPTKDELYTKIAVLLKILPTKLARTVKAVPTKVGRAIHLAIADEEGADAPAEA